MVVQRQTTPRPGSGAACFLLKPPAGAGRPVSARAPETWGGRGHGRIEWRRFDDDHRGGERAWPGPGGRPRCFGWERRARTGGGGGKSAGRSGVWPSRVVSPQRAGATALACAGRQGGTGGIENPQPIGCGDVTFAEGSLGPVRCVAASRRCWAGLPQTSPIGPCCAARGPHEHRPGQAATMPPHPAEALALLGSIRSRTEWPCLRLPPGAYLAAARRPPLFVGPAKGKTVVLARERSTGHPEQLTPCHSVSRGKHKASA